MKRHGDRVFTIDRSRRWMRAENLAGILRSIDQKKEDKTMQINQQKKLFIIFIGLILVFTFCCPIAIATDEETKNKVRVHSTARISDGMTREAFQFAKEVTAYLNSKYPQYSVQVYMEAFGATGTIHWFADYRDLAAAEHAAGQLFSDPGYLAILGKSSGLFIEGSMHDTLMMQLPQVLY
jgi:hypothetical protein